MVENNLRNFTVIVNIVFLSVTMILQQGIGLNFIDFDAQFVLNEKFQ